jgi:colanic acid/amylovoran biosynthesis protein
VDTNKIINIMIIGGNYISKGAEAMMLVVRDQVKKVFPNVNFWTTPINEVEAEKLKKDGFNLIYHQHKNRLFKVFNLAAAVLGMKQCEKHGTIQSGDKIDNIFRATDFVIDIAGFVSSDQFGPRVSFERWLNCMWAYYADNKVIFMPQSWGPFRNKWVRVFTRWTLKKASLICARERVSYDYLVNAQCAKASDVHYCSDIAFLFDVGDVQTVGRRLLSGIGLRNSELPVITITPNMRIYERVEGEDANNRYVRILLEIIHYLLENTECNVVLIPHEASYNRRNDPELCALLLELVGRRDRLWMLSGSESARQVKSVIGSSELLIASRYHSLVAAISTRTPVAVIGWSHKYDELMKQVELSDFIADPVRRGNREETLEVVIRAWKQREQIKKKLQEKVPEIEKCLQSTLEKVIDIIKQE